MLSSRVAPLIALSFEQRCMGAVQHTASDACEQQGMTGSAFLGVEYLDRLGGRCALALERRSGTGVSREASDTVCARAAGYLPVQLGAGKRECLDVAGVVEGAVGGCVEFAWVWWYGERCTSVALRCCFSRVGRKCVDGG